MKIFVSYILILCSLISCSDNPRLTFNKVTSNQKYQTSLFNLSIMFSEDENTLSFPIWFNDSILKKNQISSIHRKIFYLRTHNNICCDSTLKEEKKYFFYADGLLAGLTIKNYYDFQKISSYEILYEKKRDQFGYQFATLKNHFNRINSAEFNEEEEFPIKLCEKVKSSLDYSTYKVHNKNKHTYIINNPLFYGALKVDSLVKPKPEDAIILGSTIRPLKKYKVKNLIKETESQTFEYSSKDSNQIISISKIKYPFSTKRDFIYSNKGYLINFIDSLFSDKIFVSRTVSSILYNQKKLPYKIIHRKENQMGDTLVNSLETFEYTFNNFQ